MTVKSAVVLISSILLLHGCIIVDGDHNWGDDADWKEVQNRNVQKISQLELNSNRAEVLDLMGAPDFTEAFTRGDHNYYVLYYRTHRVKSDGKTNKSETTPLIFENGKLIGWGEEAKRSAKAY